MRNNIISILNFFKKHEFLTAGLILLVFTLVYFGPVTVNHSTLFTPGDGNIMSNGPWQYTGKIRYWGMDTWGYMLNELPGTIMIKNFFAKGVFPTWNPYGGMGAPLLSSSQTGLWNIFHIPLYLINSVKAFDFYLISKMFLAALFTYMLLRELGLRKESSAFGAIAYGFSGFFMVWLDLWFLTIDSFLPLVLFLIIKYIKTKNIKWMIGNGLLLAVLILVGNLQPVLLISVFAGLFYLFYDNLLIEFWKKRDFKVFLPLIIGFLVAYGIAGIITLPYLMAFSKDLSLAWNIHPPGISAIQMADVKSLFGYFFTPYKAFNHYQYGPVWQAVYIMYVGSIITFMAALGIFVKDKLLRRLSIFATVFSLLFLIKISINPILTSWIDHVPVFNQIAFNKYEATLFFSVAMIGAIGLDRALKAEVRWRELLLPVLFFLSLGLIYLVKRNGFLLEYHYTYWFPVLTTFFFAIVALILTMFLLLVAGKYFVSPKKKLIINVLGWFFVGAIAVESFVYSPIFRLPSAHNPIKEPPYVSFLQNKLRGEEYERVAPVGLTLAPSMQWLYGIQSINMFDAFMPQRAYDYSEKLIGCTTNFYMVTHDCPATAENKFVDLLGAKYLLSDNYLPTTDGKTLIYDKEIKIYQNNNVQPRAFVAYNYQVERSEKVLDALAKEQDPQNEIVLEGRPSMAPSDNPVTKAQISKYSQDEVVVDAEADRSGLLVLSDLYYPDWEATVDGKKAEIKPADYAFRSVEVAAGKHQVVFKYKPKKFIYLMYISIFVLLSSIGYLLLKGKPNVKKI